MSIPNHPQELTDHIRDNLNASYGKDASGGNWIDDTANNLKNKYSIIQEFRQLSLEQVKQLVKGRLNTVLGMFILTNVNIRYTRNHMKGKRYGAEYSMQIYLCSSAVRLNQMQGNRPIYTMQSDLAGLLMENPITLTGNGQIAFNLQTLDTETSDDEIDMVKMLLSIPQATVRNV